MFRATPVFHAGALVAGPTRALIRNGTWIHQLIAEPLARKSLLVLLGTDIVLIAVYGLISGGQYFGVIDERTVYSLTFFSVTGGPRNPRALVRMRTMRLPTRAPKTNRQIGRVRS